MKARGLVGVAVAIAKNGTILYAQGYGYADLSTCQPVQPTNEFQIGSVTKQFTAAAVLQPQDAGMLDLDHGVASYLPSYGIIVVTETGHEVITRFPAEQLMVAGAHYFTVNGPLSTTRENEAPPSRHVVEMIEASARKEGWGRQTKGLSIDYGD